MRIGGVCRRGRCLDAGHFHFSAFGSPGLGCRPSTDGRWDLAALHTQWEVGLVVIGMQHMGLVHALGSLTQYLDVRLDGLDLRLQGIEVVGLRWPFYIARCDGGAKRGHATTIRTNMVVVWTAAGLDNMPQDTITADISQEALEQTACAVSLTYRGGWHSRQSLLGHPRATE